MTRFLSIIFSCSLFFSKFAFGYSGPQKIGSIIDISDAFSIDVYVEKHKNKKILKSDFETNSQFFNKLLSKKVSTKFYYPIIEPIYNPEKKCFQIGSDDFFLSATHYLRRNEKLIEKRNIILFVDEFNYFIEYPSASKINGMVKFSGQDRTKFIAGDKQVLIKIPCEPVNAPSRKKSLAWVVEGPVVNNASDVFGGNVEASYIHMYAYETYVYLIDINTNQILNVVSFIPSTAEFRSPQRSESFSVPSVVQKSPASSWTEITKEYVNKNPHSQAEIGSNISLSDATTVENFILRKKSTFNVKSEFETDKEYGERLLKNATIQKFIIPIVYNKHGGSSYSFGTTTYKFYFDAEKKCFIFSDNYFFLHRHIVKSRTQNSIKYNKPYELYYLQFMDFLRFSDRNQEMGGSVVFTGQKQKQYRNRRVYFEIKCDPVDAPNKINSFAWVIEGPVLNIKKDVYNNSNWDETYVQLFSYSSIAYLVDLTTKTILSIASFQSENNN